jgi:hypothetical protein
MDVLADSVSSLQNEVADEVSSRLIEEPSMELMVRQRSIRILVNLVRLAD